MYKNCLGYAIKFNYFLILTSLSYSILKYLITDIDYKCECSSEQSFKFKGNEIFETWMDSYFFDIKIWRDNISDISNRRKLSLKIGNEIIKHKVQDANIKLSYVSSSLSSM